MKAFIKTQYANLYRYGSDGPYHVRAHVNGRLVRQSLGTKSQEIAVRLMEEVIQRERTVPRVKPSGENLGSVAARLEARIKCEAALKPTSREYKLDCLKAVRRADPELFELPPRQLKESRLIQTANKLRSAYSPTRYNGMLTILDELFHAAKLAGLVAYNPAAEIPRASVPITEPSLPNNAAWRKVLARLDAVPHRKHGAVFVRLLSLMGARISAAAELTVEDCDFARNEVLIPPVKYDDKPTRLPMFPDLRKLLKTLCNERKTGKLVSIGTPRKALALACDEAGIARLSPHKLRHLFATRCIESGVDIRTVAAWLGHKDGGALLLKRYAHLRSEHSQAMAKKVRF